MNVFGNTCPMCCGDVEDVVYLTTGAAGCLSCGYSTEATSATPGTVLQPDAEAPRVTAIGGSIAAQASSSRWLSPSLESQIQTSVGTTLP